MALPRKSSSLESKNYGNNLCPTRIFYYRRCSGFVESEKIEGKSVGECSGFFYS
jgi:hypothetical protein